MKLFVWLLAAAGIIGPVRLLAETGHGPTTTVFVYFSFLERWLSGHTAVAVVSSTWVIMAGVWLFFFTAGRRVRIIPHTLQGVAESIILLFHNFLKDQLDDRRADRYVSVVTALGLFVFFGNFLGLVPGCEGTTANWSTTIALGVAVLITYNVCGILEMGLLRHISHFFGPKLPWYLWWINLFLFPIEIISHLVRPLSLSLRLAGNMTGGHMVLAIFLGLSTVPLIYPLPIMALEFIATMVQTFIFVLLATLYIKLATDHMDGGEPA